MSYAKDFPPPPTREEGRFERFMTAPIDEAGYVDMSPSKPENVKHYAGSKKPPLGLLPPVALVETALAMAWGAREYGPWNWRDGPKIKASTYLSANRRHEIGLASGEVYASDSKVMHAAHIAANMFILMDAQASGRLEWDVPDTDIDRIMQHAMRRMEAWKDVRPAKFDVA